MQTFQLTREFTEQFTQLIEQRDLEALRPLLDELHAADIAEIFDELNLDEAVYIASLLDNSKKVDVLAELEPDVQVRFFKGYTAEAIALEFVQHMDSDDAADVLTLLDRSVAAEIISYLPNKDEQQYLSKLIEYPENSAGGLMTGELITVKIGWNVRRCIEEIRNQAENVERVLTVYVVDKHDKLVGWVSLKKLILSKDDVLVEDIYDSTVFSAEVHDSGEDIAQTMKKYDLIALPIVDSRHRLVGRVTIDDVVDFMQEEAEKDYQLLSGISENVEASDKVWVLSRARLPWLVIGLMGGITSSLVIGGFEEEIQRNVHLAFFMPLIMAMGGNAGVQSSSIVVQGLANLSIDGQNILPRILKEFSVAMINGLICSALVIAYGLLIGLPHDITLVVSISLVAAILIASMVGALIPLLLERFEIDPALATGPFITTSNDLLGLFIYFLIGNMLL
ncbi:MAG: magnesium transporter [Flavobacteriales bacterium]|nr:magnesium transporter [Flavobacteriales bacterium]